MALCKPGRERERSHTPDLPGSQTSQTERNKGLLFSHSVYDNLLQIPKLTPSELFSTQSWLLDYKDYERSHIEALASPRKCVGLPLPTYVKKFPSAPPRHPNSVLIYKCKVHTGPLSCHSSSLLTFFLWVVVPKTLLHIHSVKKNAE